MNFFNVFKKPLAQEIVTNDFAAHQKLLLEHEHAAAYHQKMVEYYRASLKRLQTYSEEGVK